METSIKIMINFDYVLIIVRLMTLTLTSLDDMSLLIIDDE